MGPSSHIKRDRIANAAGLQPSSHSRPAPGFTAASIAKENARKAADAAARNNEVPAAWEK